MNQNRVLVVDDEPDIRQLIGDILLDEGHRVETADCLAAARAALPAFKPDLILLDVWLPDGDGVALLQEWQEQGGPGAPVVMISGHGSIETAVNALKLGAYDFLEKPVSLAKLLATVHRGFEHAALKRENLGLRARVAPPPPIGGSTAMQIVRTQLERAAHVDAPLMIRGETGTGKEALARYAHGHGPRAAAPFVHFAAATMAGERGVAALFGRDTAHGEEPGAIAQAANGTLYIDEVASLDATTQARLASAIAARQYVPESGQKPRPFAARLIASSLRAPEQELQAGTLREDLYFQLNVLSVHVPALRERPEDIAALLGAQLEQVAARDSLPPRTLSAAAIDRLRRHPWPGNLRELRNLVQRLLIIGGEGEIDLDEVEDALGIIAPAPGKPAGDFLLDLSLPLRDARDRFERTYLMRQLRHCRGSVSRLAQISGMERTHLYRKLKDLGVDPKALDAAD
ncbi:MAG: sigma-54-dependent Fis family transcriptional regulator [Xanthomonadales bacterium]|nr:sigma-54-dependent Fis family transcriptional regulator [Xanthomonadales bacterium]